MDGDGKSLASLEESETPGRWVVKGATTYNLRGQERQSFQPYEQEDAAYAPPSEAAVPHGDIFHDAMGRVIVTVDPPDDCGARHLSRTDYLPLHVDTWDQEDTIVDGRHSSTPNSVISDGRGRIIRVIERNNLDSDIADSSHEYVTKYTWNLQDKLVTIRDSRQNVKYMRYDGLGRQIAINDPDAGRRMYTYDAVGNLKERVDAKGQQIVYAYDEANRLLSRSYFDKTGTIAMTPDNFTYDVSVHLEDSGDMTPAISENPRGALVTVEDSSGKAHTSYDKRGRAHWTAKVIPDPVTGIPVPYRTDYQYDTLDRVTDMVYPDGDHVSYEFNNRTMLRSARGGDQGKVVIADTQYTPSGQLRHRVTGSGVVTTYSYDRRLRMNDLLVVGAGATAGKELLHYAYTFDGASNIIAIKDLRRDFPPTDARHNSQSFEYDDLYRLRKYQLTDPALTMNRGVLEYQYDRIGNILFNSSPPAGSAGHIDRDEDGKTIVNLGAYTYAGGTSDHVGRAVGATPGPHAVSGTASGRSYTYDDSGNMIDIDGKKAIWDPLDRLVRLESPGLDATYIYDYTGQRVTKAVRRNGRLDFVLYIDQHFEIRKGEEPIKYVFAGDTRIAQVKGTLDPSRPRIQRLRLVEGWNLVTLAVEPLEATARAIFGLGEAVALVDRVVRPDGRGYREVGPQETIAVGSPLWVHATGPRMLAIVGRYSPDPSPVKLSQDANLVGWPRLEGFYATEMLRGGQNLWSYDAPRAGWLVKHLDTKLPVDNLFDPLHPGTAVWAVASGPVEILPAVTSQQDVVFYHQDHLGSSNVLTDLTGTVVHETAFYPYGAVRHEARGTSWFETNYKYTDKERDDESGLSYHGARYYDPYIGRFVSADPAAVESSNRLMYDSQRMNLYVYALNNPLLYTDPEGLQEECTGPGCPPELRDRDIYKDIDPIVKSSSTPVRKGDVESAIIERMQRREEALGKWRALMAVDPRNYHLRFPAVANEPMAVFFGSMIAVSVGAMVAPVLPEAAMKVGMFLTRGYTLARTATGGALIRFSTLRFGNQGPSYEILKIKDIFRLEMHPTGRHLNLLTQSWPLIHAHLDFLGREWSKLHVGIFETWTMIEMYRAAVSGK